MIHVGTSGYSFGDWVGPFYPKGTPPARMLEYYVRYFPVVEINSTYYRLPAPKSIANMVTRTPKQFLFTVKLQSDVTHEQSRDLADFDAFLRVIEPLETAERFGGAVAQFPFRFKNTPENREYLHLLRAGLGHRRVFVEFRHASWNRPGIYSLLDERDLGFCSVDEPQLPGLFPPVVRSVGDTAYFRFHGRNRDHWWGEDGALRYDYLYNEDELKEWAKKIHDVAGKVRQTFVFFNNCHGSSAAHNAQQMTLMLQEMAR